MVTQGRGSEDRRSQRLQTSQFGYVVCLLLSVVPAAGCSLVAEGRRQQGLCGTMFIPVAADVGATALSGGMAYENDEVGREGRGAFFAGSDGITYIFIGIGATALASSVYGAVQTLRCR